MNTRRIRKNMRRYARIRENTRRICDEYARIRGYAEYAANTREYARIRENTQDTRRVRERILTNTRQIRKNTQDMHKDTRRILKNTRRIFTVRRRVFAWGTGYFTYRVKLLGAANSLARARYCGIAGPRGDDLARQAASEATLPAASDLARFRPPSPMGELPRPGRATSPYVKARSAKTGKVQQKRAEQVTLGIFTSGLP